MQFLKSIYRISALSWSDLLAQFFVMWLMMVYLTDVWKLDFTHAAAIINVWKGSMRVLPIVLAHLADAFIGNFVLLLISCSSHTVGLWMLWMSTPPIFGKSHETCKAYKPECIGEHQKELFYIALALIAMGKAGHATSLAQFLADQRPDDYGEVNNNDHANVSCCEVTLHWLGGFAVVLFPIITVIVISLVKPWAIRFKICAIIATISTLVFLTGIFSYKYVKPVGSPMTTVLRVFSAAFSKMFVRRSYSYLYEQRGLPANDLLPHTRGLRCLDKAAHVLSKEPLEQQEQNRCRLCSVTEVEQTKIFIKMIPIWSTLILCGVVSSIGDTYFLEQAAHLNPKVGRIKVPVILLLVFYDNNRKLFSTLYSKMVLCLGDFDIRMRYRPPIGLAMAMVFSILCCITAAKVETRRLKVVTNHGLVDKPEAGIPMSIFWLLPQFTLLGALDGIYEESITRFFKFRFPSSMNKHLATFTGGAFGAGIITSALSIYVVGNFSQRGGKTNWFQSTLNHSRLDNYYWLLAALSAINFLFYVVILIFYRGRSDPDDDECELDCDDCFADVRCCCCC